MDIHEILAAGYFTTIHLSIQTPFHNVSKNVQQNSSTWHILGKFIIFIIPTDIQAYPVFLSEP